MTSALDTAGVTTTYSYDADGHRVRRVITNQPEVWQVYGRDGELLAEYPANGPVASPQKEYGYRNARSRNWAPAVTEPAITDEDARNPRIGQRTQPLRPHPDFKIRPRRVTKTGN